MADPEIPAPSLIEEFSRAHGPTIARIIYGEPRECDITLYRAPGTVADSCAIYLVDDKYVLHISPPAFPAATRQHVEAIDMMRAPLGEASRVLVPVKHGAIDGREFMAAPRLRPLRKGRVLGRLDRWRIQKAALEWVREIAGGPEDATEDTSSRFSSRLEALADFAGMNHNVSAAAEAAHKKVIRGEVALRHVPMHGDLWSGNILLDDRGQLRIIDWGSAAPEGYGLYDLMRVGSSLRVPRWTMKKEVREHIAILGGAEAAECHLLAALGHFAIHRGEFPRARYIGMAHNVWNAFNAMRGN